MENYLKPIEYNGMVVNNVNDLQKIIEKEFDVNTMLTKDTYKQKV